MKPGNALSQLIELKRNGDKDLIISVQYETATDSQYGDFIKTLDFIKKEGYNTSLFSWATVTNKMLLFFDALNESRKPIILIGPKWLGEIKYFKVSSFIETAEKNCWDKQIELEEQIEAEIKKYRSPILIYACAISGKLAISKFYQKYKNKITQIDMGANLSPYVKVFIREWHKAVWTDFIKDSKIGKEKN